MESFLSSRVIHCLSLVDGYETALFDSLVELNTELAANYPTIAPISVQLLNSTLWDEVYPHLKRNMPGVCPDDTDQHPDLSSKRLLILCDEGHPFVNDARNDNPRAHWGIGVPCKFSVAWVDNKYLWWHEALHLFNAKDCYNKFGINKCPEVHCVMQASPTYQSCGGRLHLCSKNVRRLSNEGLSATGD